MTASLFEAQEFRTILADPPWLERGGGKIKRGADRHYPLMNCDDIISTMLGCPLLRPAEHAHLYLWVTDNYLIDGLRVVDALGFRYIRPIPWVKMRNGKLQIGLGQYFRGASELLLFAVRGKGMHPSIYSGRRDLPGVIIAERTKHSRKPVESYELIEARSNGPRLEIFARRPRKNWAVWGNEVEP